MTEGSGSVTVPLTNGSGPRRPKNIRFRISVSDDKETNKDRCKGTVKVPSFNITKRKASMLEKYGQNGPEGTGTYDI